MHLMCTGLPYQIKSNLLAYKYRHTMQAVDEMRDKNGSRSGAVPLLVNIVC